MNEQERAATAPDAVIRRLQGLAGPALRFTGDDGTVFEPTGPVLANWAIKAAGLLAELGVSPVCPLLIVAPGSRLHWRALCFALGAWANGAPVVFADPESAQRPQDPEPAGTAGPFVALAPEGAEHSAACEAADEVLVYPEAPLALSVAVEPGFTDAASAVRVQPDQRVIPRIAEIVCQAPHTEAWTHVTGTADLPAEGAHFAAPHDDAQLSTLLAALGNVQIALGAP